MKKLFNISTEEKQRILEMHLGYIKPLISEATTLNDLMKLPPQAIMKMINPKGLKIGDGGTKSPDKKNDVIALQQKLINSGYLKTDTGKPTGYFGQKTDNALKQITSGQKPYFNQSQSKPTSNNVNDSVILKKINQKPQENSDEGAYSFLRKLFPNIVQLFKSKQLTNNDFTDSQKSVVLNTIKNSERRKPEYAKIGKGSTEYIDYGQNIANEFKNERGSPSTWSVFWRTLTHNDSFAMATLLGRFSWVKNPDGSYTVSDKYDFKDPQYKELMGVNRQKLEGLSVNELASKYGLSYYEAARAKGWVEHPDTIPTKSLAVNLRVGNSTS